VQKDRPCRSGSVFSRCGFDFLPRFDIVYPPQRGGCAAAAPGVRSFLGLSLDYYSGATAPAQLSSLPVTDNGLDAVRSTLRDMVAIARMYKRDAGTINVARQILVGSGIQDVRKSKPASIAAIQGWVRDHIAYVPDPRDVEMLQTPPQTLSIGTGDCDDKAILTATLLETIGFETRFMAVGGTGAEWSNDGNDWCGSPQPPPYSHVLAQVRMGQSWLCLETIVAGKGPGWCPKGIAVLMVHHV
jgi:transglutaminase-like putative cysteine protease